MRLVLLLSIALQMVPTLPSAMSQDHDRVGVNAHVYEFGPREDTPAPAGYKPVYISHYGRHGSRTGIGLGNTYKYLTRLLETASQQGNLTAEGDSLLYEVRMVAAVHDGMDGRLTRRGEQEHREIARRIYERYPEVFREGSKQIRVESSTVPRCLVSMSCFLQSLTEEQPNLSFTIDTGEKYFAYINNGCSGERSKYVASRLDSTMASVKVDSTSVLDLLFKDPAKGKALVGNVDKFQHGIWNAATVAKASGLEKDVYRYLPDDVIAKWWTNKLVRIYMQQCNSKDYGAERLERTVPLVNVILRQARQAIGSGTIAADLKFGHDYPLLALVSYFGLEGVGDSLDWDDLPLKWSDPMNIPFASNMQMVLYRKEGSKDVLVKFVYNGKERSVRGLTPVSGPYYHWDEVFRRFIPEGDDKTFACTDWGWQDVGKGAQAGYSQMRLFDSEQSIAVLRYPSAKLRTCIANDTQSEADSTSALILRYGGIAGVNGSYFNMTNLTPLTYVKDDLRQEGHTASSELFRTDAILAIGKGGHKIDIFACDTLSYRKAMKPYSEAIAAGPLLLKDGMENRMVWPAGSFYQKRHPRTIVGTTADGWVYMIVIDGRFAGQGEGATIHESAEICKMFGLKDAINLDGGGSSVLWTEETGAVSHPSDNRRFDHFGQRTVPNVVYIR